jgi:uncharacterized protein (DUF58 family)
MSALSPEVVAGIEDLEFAARLVVEGLRAGAHRSPFHGFNAEFQQHRPYRAGDDLRHLDWKLLARTDRLYSRQFRETTSMPVMLVLDASASMNFPSEGVSKFRCAAICAAALSYLIITQGDSVGLLAGTNGRLAYLPARGGRHHLRTVIARLDGLSPAGDFSPARAVARAGELLRRRGVVLALSDFYDAEEETRRELRRVVSRGHDAAMLQIVSPAETSFPFRGDSEFEDLETGSRLLLNAAAARESYTARMTAFLERCERAASRDGIDYGLISTADPPSQALRGYLLRRSHRSGKVAATGLCSR